MVLASMAYFIAVPDFAASLSRVLTIDSNVSTLSHSKGICGIFYH
jgi:hypothetical protein